MDGDSLLFSEADLPSKAPPFRVCTSLKPGDVAVELVPKVSEQQGMNCEYGLVLVYRLTRTVLCGVPASTKQLFIMPPGSVNDGELSMTSCIACNVRSVKKVLGLGICPGGRRAPCTGRLKDGRRYVVYRVLLYCDDFQPHTSKPVSYGGCYMLPMGIPPDQRACYGAVRCIGLTPPRVSSN